MLSKANPVTKLGVALAITVVLVLTVDVVSASVALGLELLALPLTGIGAGVLLRRVSPIVGVALLGGLTTLLFGEDSGATLLSFGPVEVSEGAAQAALAITLRVPAVALPSIVLLSTTDPTELADGLAQRLHLPERFVLGALAAFRLVGLLGEEWRALGQARRARGLGGRGGSAPSPRVVARQTFALLVQAVRRATRLALAMEARGFGGGPRTWARHSSYGPADVALGAGGACVAAAAVAVAVWAGTWNFVLT